jgi:hypothetical protein
MQPPAKYLVIIESSGASTALLFTAERAQVAEIDASSEEVQVMTRGLVPQRGATGGEWDRPLAGSSQSERAEALVYALDV